MGNCLSGNATPIPNNRTTSIGSGRLVPTPIKAGATPTPVETKKRVYTPIPTNIPQEFNDDQLIDLLPNNNCNLDCCAAMIRFKYILDHHDEELIQYGAYEFINKHLNKYNNIHLLNDYHHLMFVHEYEFEEIYNKLGACNLEKCTSYTRNHRDRSNINTSRAQYNKFTNNNHSTKETNTVQIIDQIHCYFLHTFDVLYKLNKQDQQKLNAQIEEMYRKEKELDNDNVSLSGSDNDRDTPVPMGNETASFRVRAWSKHMDELKKETNLIEPDVGCGPGGRGSRFSRARTLKRKRSKYCELARIVSAVGTATYVDDDQPPSRFGSRRNISTVFSHEDLKMIDEVEDKMDDIDSGTMYDKENDIVYSFGVRFVYDKKQKHDEWYVKAKWDSLKDELLCNCYDDFGVEHWNELVMKAQDYINTKRVKEDCKFRDTGDVMLKNKNKVTMDIDHVIAIMLYCNFDKLQAKFSESYRKGNDESCEDLKNRHSEWHQLGKYLRQLVEVYGTKILSEEQRLRRRGKSCSLDKSGKLKFYHGINQEMVFVSTSAKICGPLSTSSEPFVALNFAGNEGLLLELSGTNARFFDCCGISDYSNEKEKFFLGGYDTLLIETVINPRTIDYRPYIVAINIISCLFNGQQYYSRSSKPFSGKTCTLVYSLLFYHKLKDKLEKPLEVYVEKLFNHYAKNVKEITIDWKLMTMEYDDMYPNAKGFKFIKHKICMDSFDWIKMNRIVSLFKHLQIIQLNYIGLTNKVIEYILSVLSKHQNDENYKNLNKIIIYQPIQHGLLRIPDALAIYADKFRQTVKWRLFVQDKDHYNDLCIAKL